MDDLEGASEAELDVLDSDDSSEEETEETDETEETSDEESTEETDETDEDDSSEESDDEDADDDDASDDEDESEDSLEDDEDEESDDEELESLGNRPSFKQLKDAFPELKKKFPGVFEALGAERSYRNHFPTVADAKEGAEKLASVAILEDSINAGQPGLLLGTLKQNDPALYSRFVDNFVGTIEKHDQESYNRVARPIFANCLRALAVEAGRIKDENLDRAVKKISLIAFNTTEVPDFSPKRNPEAERLSAERRELLLQNLKAFEVDVQGRIGSVVDKHVDHLIKDIKLDPFSRKALKDAIIDRTNNILRNDPVHMNTMKRIRDKAKQAGYSSDSCKSQLTRAYRERFAQIVPAVKRKLVARLRTTGKGKPMHKANKPKVATSKNNDGSKKPSSGKIKSGGLSAQEAFLAGK